MYFYANTTINLHNITKNKLYMSLYGLTEPYHLGTFSILTKFAAFT